MSKITEDNTFGNAIIKKIDNSNDRLFNFVIESNKRVNSKIDELYKRIEYLERMKNE